MFKRILLMFLVGITVTSISVGTALGDLTNTNRPYGTNLTELQSVFSGIGSTINAYNDQSEFGYFEPMAGGNAASTYIATVSWGWPGIEFGIYELGNTSNRLMMFDYNNSNPFTPGYTVNVEFWSTYVVAYSSMGQIDITYDPMDTFGFYGRRLEGYDPFGNPIFSETFFSEDDLNTGGYARVLTYEGKGDVVTIGNRPPGSDAEHWYIAGEFGDYENLTWNWNTETGDFTDFVVLMESITPVPVPAAILLGVLGLGVAGMKLRKYA